MIYDISFYVRILFVISCLFLSFFFHHQRKAHFVCTRVSVGKTSKNSQRVGRVLMQAVCGELRVCEYVDVDGSGEEGDRQR